MSHHCTYGGYQFDTDVCAPSCLCDTSGSCLQIQLGVFLDPKTITEKCKGCLCILVEQREFETSLKKRKRDFGETLERYEAEVDKYAQRSEMSKRDEVAAQVMDLSQKLKEVRLSTKHVHWCSLLNPVAKLQSST